MENERDHDESAAIGDEFSDVDVDIDFLDEDKDVKDAPGTIDPTKDIIDDAPPDDSAPLDTPPS